MSKIAVATMNPRLYYKIVRTLRSFNISFISVLPHESLPKDVKVVLTSSLEVGNVCHKNKIVVSEDRVDEAVFKAICMTKNKEHFNQLVFGIDPGATYGIVVLADGELIAYKLFKSIKKLTSYVNRFSSFPYKTLIIKIGTGSKEYLRILLDAFKSVSLPNFRLELVDEKPFIPSLVKDFNLQSDIKSAYGIALSRGRRLK